MIITEQAVATIQRHGEETYPEECCGFLIGTPTGKGNEITHIVPVHNRAVKNRNKRYRISAGDYRDADHEARTRDLDVVGFYHSHPDHPAEPSATDLAEATLPGYSYVIVSVLGGSASDVTAWVLAADRSRFERESIGIVEPEDFQTDNNL